MFPKSTYVERRDQLKKLVKSGIVLFPGNNHSPMNYPSNEYKFRQDSNFLYYFGLDSEHLCGLIDIDNDEEILIGDDRSIDDVIWMGPQTPLKELADEVGISLIEPSSSIANKLNSIKSDGRKIHYAPQYRHDLIIAVSEWLDIKPAEVNNNSSVDLIKSIVSQRTIKTDEEIEQIEHAIAISYEMNVLAMRYTRPGLIEREVFGALEGLALGMGKGISFPIIFSVRGETLHNHEHENIMKDGDLAILDSGVESELHYASDITRTIPVNGKFTDRQKEIYQIVLDSQMYAINEIKPGVSFRDIHKGTAKVIAEGLSKIGLMKGNVDDAVDNGAHALFFPHGLGHMMGLDVHDLEGMGENFVGYSNEIERSEQFGLAYLRFAKQMETGHVVTLEPGIYFIPQLLQKWKSEAKHTEFVNYDKAEEYIGFGGVRIEDDVLVTQDGHRVLGKPIPKTIEEVEKTCND